MAENESLDLGGAYAKRWDVPFDSVRKGESCRDVARLVKRHSPLGPRKPARTLGLKVQVFDEAFWNRHDIRDTIGEAVDFVSGDFWEFEFVKDSGWSARRPPSSHPEFLRLMSRLASLVAENDIEFRLPFFGQTRGEAVKKLTDLNLQELANMTASCVGFPLRHSQAKQCGICPACLFRRQALHVAGIAEPDHSYLYDIFSPFPSVPISMARLKYLKAFLMQVAQLNDVETHDRIPRAFERHLLSTNILQRGQSQKGVIDLLARYRDEWIAIASHARRNGQAWAKWIAPQQPKERQVQGVTYASA